LYSLLPIRRTGRYEAGGRRQGLTPEQQREVQRAVRNKVAMTETGRYGYITIYDAIKDRFDELLEMVCGRRWKVWLGGGGDYQNFTTRRQNSPKIYHKFTVVRGGSVRKKKRGESTVIG